MGVRYYQCAACNESIYEEAVARCASCSQFVCVTCAIRLPKGLGLRSGDIYDPDRCAALFDVDHCLLRSHCPMCRGRSVSNAQVTARLLSKTGTTAAQVKQQILAERKTTGAKPRKKRTPTTRPRVKTSKKKTVPRAKKRQK